MSSNPKNHYALEKLLGQLKTAKILNDEIAKMISNHPNLEGLVIGCGYLLKANILTPSYFSLLSKHKQPGKVGRVLNILQSLALLNDEQFLRVQRHDFPALIIRLYDNHLLSAENITEIFRPENSFLISRDAEINFWTRIEDAFLREHWPVILTIAGRADPMAALQALRTPAHEVSVQINPTQSTHTQSIHRSASLSALRLYQQYQKRLVRHNIQFQICLFLMTLSSNFVNNAAKRGFERLSASSGTFIDHESHLSIMQLLELSFFAILDDSQRIGSKADALTQWIAALYEIQRGYNIDKGRDDGQKDRPICSGGAFHKILEKLQGIHPLIELKMINLSIASLKLPIVVEEEAYLYLNSLASPDTKQGYLAFLALMERLQKEGIIVIWPRIQEQIKLRVSDEFAELFPTSAALDSFVLSGQDKSLDKLYQFQEKLEMSAGYRAWCRTFLMWNKPDTLSIRENPGSMLKLA